MEREQDKIIPFLDLKLEVKNKEVGFDIYRKPQHIQRYIPSSSCHPTIHKIAAFESMIFRLFNTPLSEDKFKREKKFIEETAEINGYRKQIINSLMKKHEAIKNRKNLTTLTPIEKEKREVKAANGKKQTIFVELPFIPGVSDKIQKILNKHNMNTFYTSSRNLKELIGNLKDKIPAKERSGIYELSCKTCEAKYRGQTKRKIIQRDKEHNRAFRLKQPKKSAMAQHCLDENHQIGNCKLLKEVRDQRQLDAWESLKILKGENLVNIDEPLISSPLFELI